MWRVWATKKEPIVMIGSLKLDAIITSEQPS